MMIDMLVLQYPPTPVQHELWNTTGHMEEEDSRIVLKTIWIDSESNNTIVDNKIT